MPRFARSSRPLVRQSNPDSEDSILLPRSQDLLLLSRSDLRRFANRKPKQIRTNGIAAVARFIGAVPAIASAGSTLPRAFRFRRAPVQLPANLDPCGTA